MKLKTNYEKNIKPSPDPYYLLDKYYGNLTERQFQTLYRKVQVKNNLPGLLESRLDVVIYRMGLAPTLFSARQMINHGMFLVNKKRITAKGFLLNPGDVVEVADIFWLRTFKNILKRLKKNTFFIGSTGTEIGKTYTSVLIKIYF